MALGTEELNNDNNNNKTKSINDENSTSSVKKLEELQRPTAEKIPNKNTIELSSINNKIIEENEKAWTDSNSPKQTTESITELNIKQEISQSNSMESVSPLSSSSTSSSSDPVLSSPSSFSSSSLPSSTTPTDSTNTTTVTEEKSTSTTALEIIQDPGFTIELQSPGALPLPIQVSSMELVQEIHQLLMDREDTCHRTCFSLQLDGVTLDNFAELKNIEGLKEGSTVKVVEEPYTMREARIHVRHIRDLLKSMDPADAYNGIDCYSLTFLHNITQGDLLEKKKTRPESVDCTPPEYIMPGSKDRPLLPLQPGIKSSKMPQSLKVLTTSAWNPPPGPRKLHGDLMYLYVITMEEKRFHITACPHGFYINQSTEEIFNPKPDNPSHLCHSLIDLLSQISPTFKRSFIQMQKRRTLRHPFERVATPYQIYTWCAPSLEHTLDAIRAEDTFSSKLGYEEHIPGQTRDWNEELQTTRELSRKTLPDRLLRERAIFKVHSDFVTAATRGAMAVIDGNVMAINPGEDAKMQMFIWNNIFFSLGFDVRDHYKELGGDAAAFVAPRNDLHGVRVYSAVDVEGLYTLGTVVIDYRGYRVTAQSIIPGILEREQEQSVVYGSIDFGKTVLGHPKYFTLLNKAGQQLKILPHSVLNEKNEPIELCSSVECKGIIGNDGRHYILDLLRTFPPDVNFLKLPNVQLSKDCENMGFPIEHKHKLSCLRQELLDAFVEDRYVMFIKYAAYHLQQITSAVAKNKQTKNEDTKNNNNNSDSTATTTVKKVEEVQQSNGTDTLDKAIKSKENSSGEIDKTNVNTEEAKKIMESFNDPSTTDAKQAADSRDIVKRACAAVDSLKEYEFDIRFNPDCYSPGIQHVDHPSDANSLDKQKHLVKQAAEFLLTTQIPSFIRDCLDHSSAPMDGTTLTEAIHNRGINVRYLGKVATLLARVKRLDYLYTIAVQELILRATKHIFYTYMQNTDIMNLSSAISHFFNCLFSSSSIFIVPPIGQEELQKTNKRRNNKRRNAKNPYLGNDNSEYATLTQKSLWQQIRKELKSYWDFDLRCENVESVCEIYRLNKLSILRAFCLKVGIQILLREYNFELKHKPIFTEDDIVNVFPIVKHINPRATDAYNFYTTGQTKIQQGFFKEGFELISEALSLLNNVYGAMHSENAQCLRMLARLSYIMGDPQEALAIQQRAVLMSERVNGIDHPYTISEYAHLALYSFANSQISTALKLLYRARYLALLICGENHPDIALLDSNISLILHAVGEYELSLRFLEHALALNIKYYDEKSLKVAVSYHLVARTQSCMGDFRSALISEKETYAIYKQQLGEDHEKTQESSECLRHLTQQAVVLQKKMNDICSNGKLTSELPPIHIQPPSMDSVLDMLNAINGILFVQISQKDIANLKNEIEKRQREAENQQTVDEATTSIINNTIDNNNDNNGTEQNDVTKDDKESTINDNNNNNNNNIDDINNNDDKNTIAVKTTIKIVNNANDEPILNGNIENVKDDIQENKKILINNSNCISNINETETDDTSSSSLLSSSSSSSSSEQNNNSEIITVT